MANRVTVFLTRCGKPHRGEAERQTQGQVIYVSLANGQVPLTADYGNKVASHMLAHLQCPTGLSVVQQASPSPCDKDRHRRRARRHTKVTSVHPLASGGCGENVLSRLQKDCEGIRASLVTSWGCRKCQPDDSVIICCPLSLLLLHTSTYSFGTRMQHAASTQ